MSGVFPNRREVLKALGVVGAAAALPLGGRVLAGTGGGPTGGRRRIGRIAHVTDLHIEPERSADRGVAQCLHHVQAMADRPSMIVFGGDMVMDAYDQEEPRAKLVYDLFQKTVRDNCSLPMKYTLGNHDIWGWNRKKSGLSANEPLYGKRFFCDRYGLERTYHAFDVGAGPGSWRVVVLDSLHTCDGYGEKDKWGYKARLDPEQFAWLEAEIDALDPERWMMIVSHIPILSASALFSGDANTPLHVESALIHEDARQLHDLFLRRPRVRLCVSGHIHQLDRVDYDALTYICAGAVCGNWWKGPYKQCNEGFSTFDLFSDGTHEWNYHTYGWKAVAE